MSYIGNSPTNIAFQTDTFSGTGSTTAFTMSVAPANTTSVLVAVTGVLQDPSTYSVSGTTLTFSAAPPSGTSNISVRYLGIPASGVTTTAYRTVTDFTATAGQTSFSTPSYTVGYVDVYRNGVRLVSTDYTATTGTTVVLANACTLGDAVVTESFYVSSVLNALPTTGGTVSGNLVVSGTETVSTITSPAATALTLQTNNGTTALTVDASQNVGIGTTSPSGKLNVISGSVAQLIIGFSGTSASYLDSDLIVFRNAATTERMRIDTSGFTYINCTSSVASVSSYSNIAFSGLSYFGISIKTTYASAGSTFAAFINSAGTQQGAIYANATNTTQYQTSSDYRLKENIVPMIGALDKVSQLKPCTFKWKSDGSSSQGFIAHELQTVVPECVGGEKDAVDADGNPKYQGVDTSFLVATLTAAIQEQQALITQLQADVAALKGKP
jgi:hypothetical protein